MPTSAEIGAEAVDATFQTWGVAALYTPPGGGSGIVCIVIQDRRDRSFDLDGAKPVGEGRVVEVRASEVSDPKDGGQFAVGTKTYKIAGKPETEDPERLVFVCNVG
jgi:hypothetical protein